VCDIVALCVSTDEDVMQIVSGGLLDGIRPGSVVVNWEAACRSLDQREA
jgi:3-hydroxyisobutyrate dehydrogenase-like beta-hydroxyacid dehydrogenase